MPGIFSGKARKTKDFLLEINNHYNVQRLEKDDEVSLNGDLLKRSYAIMVDEFEKTRACDGGNLIWLGFKGFFVDKFMPEYQELREEMNLVYMRDT